MGRQREEMWDFEETIYRHRPTDAGYYFLVRYGRNHEIIRLPAEGAWRAREPMEEPIAPGGAWFVQYSKDAHGRERVHPVGKVGPLRVVLRWPENNGATADPDATTEEAGDGTEGSAPASQAVGDSMLAKLLASGVEEDDAEGSVKTTRINARKMGIALRQKERIHNVGKHQALSREVVDCLKTNEILRQQLAEQAALNTKVHREGVAALERNMALFERMQVSAGRQQEREFEASMRAACPPAPPDYTPVLNTVVSTIRDIGVAALQRDSTAPPPALPSGPAVKAALSEGAPPSEATAQAKPTAQPSHAHLDAAASPSPSRPSYEELLAQRDRLRADLAAAEIRKTLQNSESAPRAMSVAASEPPQIKPMTQAATSAPTHSATSPIAPLLSSVLPEAGPPPLTTQSQAAPSPAPQIPAAASALFTDTIAQSAGSSNGGVASPEPPLVPTPPLAPKVVEAAPASLGAAVLSPVNSAPPAPAADAAAAPDSPPASKPSIKPAPPRPTPAPVLGPSGLPVAFPGNEILQGILVNDIASRLLDEQDDPRRPYVAPVQQVEKVLLDPPKMDPETARRLLKDGTALESFGAYLFFNPMIRDALLRGRGK